MLVGEVKWQAKAATGWGTGAPADTGALPGAAEAEPVHALFVPDAAGVAVDVEVVDARTVMAVLR